MLNTAAYLDSSHCLKQSFMLAGPDFRCFIKLSLDSFGRRLGREVCVNGMPFKTLLRKTQREERRL